MTDGDIPRRKLEERWTTVSVVSLMPGWVNRFRSGKRDEIDDWVDHSPAILVQELRSVEHWVFLDTVGLYDIEQTERCDLPYETRAVFATVDYGALDPACDVDNYVDTVWRG